MGRAACLETPFVKLVDVGQIAAEGCHIGLHLPFSSFNAVVIVVGRLHAALHALYPFPDIEPMQEVVVLIKVSLQLLTEPPIRHFGIRMHRHRMIYDDCQAHNRI